VSVLGKPFEGCDIAALRVYVSCLVSVLGKPFAGGDGEPTEGESSEGVSIHAPRAGGDCNVSNM